MRNSRAGKSTLFAIALMVAVAAVVSVSAHRRDEYLQAARIDIGADRVVLELSLTPGIAVAGSIVAEIDRDHDGVLSAHEQRAYAATVLSAVNLEVDGRPIRPQLMASTFPGPDAFKEGEGTIAIRSAAVLTVQAAGSHHLRFRNTHRSDVSVYLANAMTPASDRLVVTAQRRDRDQRELVIDYVVKGWPAMAGAAWLLAGIVGFAAATLLTKR